MNDFEIEIIPSIDDDFKSATVELSGELVYKNISKIYESIKPAYEEFKSLTINLKEVSNIDLSMVQLIISLKNDREVLISGKLEDDSLSLIKNSGIELF